MTVHCKKSSEVKYKGLSDYHRSGLNYCDHKLKCKRLGNGEINKTEETERFSQWRTDALLWPFEHVADMIDLDSISTKTGSMMCEK